MKIHKNKVVSATILKVELVEQVNSWVIQAASVLSDGSYELHDIWTNSTDKPIFSVGQPVVLLPVKGKDGKTRYSPLPA